MTAKEHNIEENFIKQLKKLKYTYKIGIKNMPIFCSGLLNSLLIPLKLNWKSRKELIKNLTIELIYLLEKIPKGRDISRVRIL